MYCLKCGKEQPAGQNRFCTQCGFAFEEAVRLLTNEKQPPPSAAASGKNKLSDRAKGILQGIIMFPLLFGLFAMLIVIYDNIDVGTMDATYSAITLILLMSLVRILYAAFFEEGKKRQQTKSQEPKLPPSLPPPSTLMDDLHTIRKKTGELFQRGSITEHPTQPLHEK